MKSPMELFRQNEKKLLRQKEEIRTELEMLNAQDKNSDDDIISESELESRVESLFERSQLIMRRANLKKTLSDVSLALKRIKKNDYGVCQNCKKPIQDGRLKAFPAAKYCIECAASMENK